MRASSVEHIILEILSAEQDHLTSLQIYERIRPRLPAVNPSTVYRALERLVRQGKVSISDMGTGAIVYESLANGRHHHLVCQKCGRVLTVQDEAIREFFSTIQAKYHFSIATNHLILFGTCEDCSHSPD